MSSCRRRSDTVRDTIRLCNLASARLIECGSALRNCSGKLGRFRTRLEQHGLAVGSEASILKSLASACEQTSERLCEAGGELAASDTPDEDLGSLVPLTRLTTRLLSIAESRAKMMVSILDVSVASERPAQKR